jgi:two-component system NtrC family sensor kinase
MRLGLKLTLYLVGAVICTMSVFAYVSIRADRENFLEELSQGMKVFGQAVGETLSVTYGEDRDLEATQEFVSQLGPIDGLHGLVVYDASGEPVAFSPSFIKHPVKGIQPGRVLKTGKDEVGYKEIGDTVVYYRLEPIFDPSGNIAGAFLLVRRGKELAQDLFDRRDRIIGTTSALIIVLVVLIFFLVDRNVSRPIGELIRRIRAIGTTTDAEEATRMGQNEITALEREFNLMSARLAASNSRLHDTEKSVLVAQLATGLAHEIATPLGIIGGRAENLLRRDRSPEEVRANLEIIRSQIDRIVRVVQRLLDFSRPKPIEFREIDILEIIDYAKTLLEQKLTQKGAVITISADDPVPRVIGDADQLQQVFINLFLNGLDAVDSRGALKVRIDRGEIPGDSLSPDGFHKVRITFEDNGRGIPKADITHIFDPFFSTKEPGSGTGLGLFITNDIIKAHGGSIDVESEPGYFTRFTIFLPAAAQDDHEAH